MKERKEGKKGRKERKEGRKERKHFLPFAAFLNRHIRILIFNTFLFRVVETWYCCPSLIAALFLSVLRELSMSVWSPRQTITIHRNINVKTSLGNGGGGKKKKARARARAHTHTHTYIYPAPNHLCNNLLNHPV
jgi:hypothetical protein